MKPGARSEGWGWPIKATKPHFFVDGRSLCGRWLFTGNVEPGPARVGMQDCKACSTALARTPRRAAIPAYQPSEARH